jgi:hypothetical protein
MIQLLLDNLLLLFIVATIGSRLLEISGQRLLLARVRASDVDILPIIESNWE